MQRACIHIAAEAYDGNIRSSRSNTVVGRQMILRFCSLGEDKSATGTLHIIGREGASIDYFYSHHLKEIPRHLKRREVNIPAYIFG